MKFTCDKLLLCDAINAAQKAVALKSSFKALEGLLITAGNGFVKLTGFDLSLGIESKIEANVTEEGSIVVDSRSFGEIIRKLPSNEVCFSSNEKMVVNISCNLAEFNISGMNAEEFPELPSVAGSEKFTIGESTMRSMIRQTLFAVAQSDSKPAHTGALFEIKNNILSVIAVDGFRLALRRQELKNGFKDCSFIIPGKTLSEILKLLSDDDGDIAVCPSNKHIMFEIGNNLLVSRLIDGEFINYQNVIPKENKISTVVSVSDIAACVDRASIIINEKLKGPVKCDFEHDVIKITSKTAEGTSYNELPAMVEGGTLEIGFNNRYMLEALKACECEKVRIELSTPLSPMVLLPTEGDAFLMLVLPVRLRNE